MKTLIVLLIAVACVSYPVLSLAGESQDTAGGTDRATTVKSGKSNSSDRVGGGGETAAEGSKVKGSKSNTSERSTTVKSSKSNSSERSTVKSGKSNSDN